MERESGHFGSPSPWLSSELGRRVVSGLVLIAFALVLTLIGGWLFALLWLAAAIVIAFEWTAMAGVQPLRPVQAALALALAALAILPFASGSVLAGTLVVAAGAGAAVLLPRTGHGRLWALAGFLYAAVIALVPPLVRADPALAVTGVLWMFAVVWTTDVVAYFTGRRFGGPKLWPRVSPKKTWSGFAGGLLGGTLLGTLVVLLAGRTGAFPGGTGGVVMLSAMASVASQLGDLGESALKRRFGVKDSGHLIPGHGGVMDRLDGFWAVAVLAGLILAGLHARPM